MVVIPVCGFSLCVDDHRDVPQRPGGRPASRGDPLVREPAEGADEPAGSAAGVRTERPAAGRLPRSDPSHLLTVTVHTRNYKILSQDESQRRVWSSNYVFSQKVHLVSCRRFDGTGPDDLFWTRAHDGLRREDAARAGLQRHAGDCRLPAPSVQQNLKQ